MGDVWELQSAELSRQVVSAEMQVDLQVRSSTNFRSYSWST